MYVPIVCYRSVSFLWEMSAVAGLGNYLSSFEILFETDFDGSVASIVHSARVEEQQIKVEWVEEEH